MQKSIFISVLSLLIFCSELSAQKNKEARLFSAILKSQRHFCRHSIPAVIKDAYVSILNLAPKIRSQVIEQIEKSYPLFFDEMEEFNLVEGYDLPHGDVYGMIWKGDTIFTYVYPSMQNAVIVKEKKYSELLKDERDILSNFSDWSNPIFKSTIHSPRHVHPPSYYMASRVVLKVKPDITTIGFCY